MKVYKVTGDAKVQSMSCSDEIEAQFYLVVSDDNGFDHLYDMVE